MEKNRDGAAPADAPGNWLTVRQVADRLHYSYPWVLNLIAQGKIKASRPLGGSYRVSEAEVRSLEARTGRRNRAEGNDSTGSVEIEIDDTLAQRIGLSAPYTPHVDPPDEEEAPQPAARTASKTAPPEAATKPPAAPGPARAEPEPKRRGGLGLDFQLFGKGE